VWALKDISFEVKQGEVLGIIGRNGAGKSTLLKILSKVTTPSTGRIKIKGRIASLLEVGTGFHQELTGRENIFLNGAILGMNKSEIKSKFDEIVDFSGVERYIDTPVKRYSSGMYVRLAFAVAAFLEPEILIIDEVLAVGDSEFQKKCLGRMQDVSRNDGRTVLFVSHNMGMIAQLCNTSILMQRGSVIYSGNTLKVIDYYLQNNSSQVEEILRNATIKGNYFKQAYMCDTDRNKKNNFAFDESISIAVNVALPVYNNSLELAMRAIDKNKNAVFTIHEKLDKYSSDKKSASVLITIPPKFLTPGIYSWIMCINHPGQHFSDLQDDVLPFSIVDTGSDFARYEGANYGSVFAAYSVKSLN
jgi:lipopolysaccharide transport system ATP-binding protein